MLFPSLKPTITACRSNSPTIADQTGPFLSQLDISQALHILNPSEKNRGPVSRYFAKNSSLRKLWVDRTSHPTHLETLIEWAINERRRRFFIWGGDGTFNRAVQALQERKKLSDVEVALVPAGTCNDFARKASLGPFLKMMQKMKNQRIYQEKIDVGLVSAGGGKRVFLNNAGFGRKPLPPGVKSSNPIRDILSFESQAVQIEWGTQQLHQFEQTRVFFGIIFNSPYFNCGMHFNKNISPKDGILNGFLVPPQSKSKLFSRFVRSRLGFSLRGKSDITLESTFINIESESLIYPQVDGEWAAPKGVHRVEFSLHPEKLSLLVPAAG